MTDLENREAFEVEMEKLIGKVLSIRYSEEDGGYIAHKLMMSDKSTKMLVNIFNFSFAMWQASSQRQGFKLVPLEPSEEMIDCVYDEDGDYVASIDGSPESFYKAMINAV